MLLLHSEPKSAAANMQRDVEILEGETQSTLHFYEWISPACTYGHFINPAEWLNLEGLNLQLARRPTGGGILFHEYDLAFSLFIPASDPAFSTNTLDSYRYVNSRVAIAIERALGKSLESALLPTDPKEEGAMQHFCMAKPTIYDVMIGARKVGGAAQRRTRRGLLHQGSIALGVPPQSFLERALRYPEVVLAMTQNTFAIGDTPAIRQRLRDELVTIFQS